jgi:hypothetical protein
MRIVETVAPKETTTPVAGCLLVMHVTSRGETFRRALESGQAADSMDFDGNRPDTVVMLVEL